MTKTHQTTDSTPRSPETALWQAALEQVLKDAIIPRDCPERQEACAFLTAPDNPDLDLILEFADLDPITAREALPRWTATWSDSPPPSPWARNRGRPRKAVSLANQIRSREKSNA